MKVLLGSMLPTPPSRCPMHTRTGSGLINCEVLFAESKIDQILLDSIAVLQDMHQATCVQFPYINKWLTEYSDGNRVAYFIKGHSALEATILECTMKPPSVVLPVHSSPARSKQLNKSPASLSLYPVPLPTVTVPSHPAGPIGIERAVPYIYIYEPDGTLVCISRVPAPRVNIPPRAATQRTPLPTAGVSVSAVAGGAYHTCAVASGGGLWCWGLNGNGQLGIGSTADQLSPVAVSLGAGVSCCCAAH